MYDLMQSGKGCAKSQLGISEMAGIADTNLSSSTGESSRCCSTCTISAAKKEAAFTVSDAIKSC